MARNILFFHIWLAFWLHIIVVAHSICGQKFLKDPPKLINVQPAQSEHRLLLSGTPHRINIFGHYLSSPKDYDLKKVQTMFGVATAYYRRVIKVTEMGLYSTVYPPTVSFCNFYSDSGGGQVPQQYLKYGFQKKEIDLVVFIVLVSEKEEKYIASASPCVKARRPIYGFINFNTKYMDYLGYSQAAFHEHIMATVHELTHILGFNQQFYEFFYISPTSQVKYPMSKVVRNNGLRKMIITPTVKAYIATHFGCQDEVAGALLEDEGGLGSSYSHWQRRVFLDEVMTASNWSPGLRITPITLMLLKDTGFYNEVNQGQAEAVTWGANRGCPFVMSTENAGLQFCQPKQKGCDFYSKFSGHCTSNEYYSSNASIYIPYNNTICADSEYSKTVGTPTRINNYMTYGPGSRCFEVQGNTSTCLKAYCDSNTNGTLIVVHLNHIENVTCSVPTQKMTIGGMAFFCPKNFSNFCNVQHCKNHCSQRGLCIRGSCVCNPPYYGESCQQSCKPDQVYNTDEQTCRQGCSVNRYVDPNRVCVASCPAGYQPNSNHICVLCRDMNSCDMPDSKVSYTTRLLSLIIILLLIF